MGWGLTICLWLGPPWFNYWFSFTLAYSKISHEYSSLFIIVINLFLCFHFDELTELGAFMRTEFLCVSVFRVASGPRVKLASCKSALNPPVVYSTDRSKAVVPVLVLLFVALWFILRGDLYVFPCVILFLCFSVLLVLRLPRLGKRELILLLFVHLFDLVLVWTYRFPLPLGVWEGLRFVIVALPGLFSYLFLIVIFLFYCGIHVILCFIVSV